MRPALIRTKCALVLIVLVLVILIVFFNVFRTQETVPEEHNVLTRNCSTVPMLVLSQHSPLFPNGVPRLVHYDYRHNLVPSQYEPLIQGCVALNPGVRFVLWTDEMATSFIQTFFGDVSLQIYRTYLRSEEALKKSDVLRFFLMYKFGGVYMDLDTRCQRPLQTVMGPGARNCLLSREADVQARILWGVPEMAANSFMACVPGHPFFGSLVSGLRRDDGTNIMWQTGPLFLTNKYHKFVQDPTRSLDSRNNISLESSDLFSPLVETFLEEKCQERMWGTWKKRGCMDLVTYRKEEARKVNEAVVVHLFYHLGYQFARHKIQGRRDICEIKSISVVIKNKEEEEERGGRRRKRSIF